MKIGLSYGDVCMLPKYNNITSRTLPTFKTQATKSTAMQIPIFAANMDTVIGPKLAEVLVKLGSYPVFHRFYKMDKINELVDLVKKYEQKCYMSWGVTEIGFFFDMIQTYGLSPRGVFIDIAHGHSMMAQEAIGRIKERFPQFEIVAGNVCTPEAVMDLAHWGADAVKVGIGPGSVCTTRSVTAFGAPQFTAVQECAAAGKRLKVPIIADGGIKGSREIILSLAAGANSVMIGRLYAETLEADNDGHYRGQASQSFQNDYFGGVKEGTIPEGIFKMVRKTIPADKMTKDLLAGLASGMTYTGAKTIPELQEKAEFMTVTENYWK